MRLKMSVIVTSLFLLIQVANAQKDKLIEATNTLVFDADGHLIGYPNIVSRKCESIAFQVKLPLQVVRNEKNQFTTSLKYAVENLKAKQNYYACYFKDSMDLSQYIIHTDTIIARLDSLDFCKGLMVKQNILAIPAEQNIPVIEFLNNLLDSQFIIQVFQTGILVKTIPLHLVPHCENECIYFGSPQKYKIKDIICNGCQENSSEQLTFKLIRTDPWSQTLKDWFELQNKVLEKSIDEIKDGLDAMALENDPATDNFNDAMGNIKSLKSWFPKWFWYTKGNLTLDPFHTLDEEQLKELENKVKENNQKLADLKQEKTFTDSVIANLDYKLNNFRKLKLLQNHNVTLTDKIDQASTLNKNLSKEIAGRNKLLPNIRPKAFLNSVILVWSSFSSVRPQKQLNALNGYLPVFRSHRKLNRVIEFPENEMAYLMLYNVDSAVHIVIQEKRSDYDDKEEFTKLIAEQLSKVDLTSLTSASIDKLQSFSKSFTSKTNLVGSTKDVFNCNADDIKKNPINKELKGLADAYAAGSLTAFYKSSPFIDGIPDSAVYYTVAKSLANDFEYAFRDSISINQLIKKDTEKQLAKTYIKGGKLRFVQIASGLAMTKNAVTTTNIDTSGNGFKVTSSDNKATAIIGFKLYPFQNYNRDKWIRPRYIQHRLSIFGGFEMLHPLNNFYIGGCYDLVPGLGVSVGNNFSLETTYKISNNAITDTHRRYKDAGLYYSVVLDPVLFVQFVKLFFK